jgi:hypothetical protein
MVLIIILLIVVFVTTNEAKRLGTPLASKFYWKWHGEQYDQKDRVRTSRRHHDDHDYFAMKSAASTLMRSTSRNTRHICADQDRTANAVLMRRLECPAPPQFSMSVALTVRSPSFG